jgi:thiamine pyrophosphokinase
VSERRSGRSPIRRAIVLADGDVASRAALDASWPGWSSGVDLVVAADGGARHAAGLGLVVGHWVGDGDSLPADELEALRAAGTPIDLVDEAKDQSDTELAIGVAVAAGAEEIVVLGAFGGSRLDHALANISLLGGPALIGRDAVLLDGGAQLRLVRAPGPDGAAVTVAVGGEPGGIVSLLPYGRDVEGVTTTGLRYPLSDEPLLLGSARGLSNVREAGDASLAVRSGTLLVVESPARLSR